MKHHTRRIAFFLLLLWVGPVTLVQTDSGVLRTLVGAPGRAAAWDQTIPARQAMVLEPGTTLTLLMRDRSYVEGRLLGRTLLDSAMYAPRFAKYARTSAFVPFAMGETLRVSLRDGREMTAPFAGYGELTLLLRSPADTEYVRVPFESAFAFHRARGDSVQPKTLARAFHHHQLPSAEALVMGDYHPYGSAQEQWDRGRRVAADDIQSATVQPGPGGGSVAAVALGIVIGVAVGVLLFAIAVEHGSPNCGGNVSFPTNWFTNAHLTTRPFDLDRGCYVGDPLATADPWPGAVKPATTSESGPLASAAIPTGAVLDRMHARRVASSPHGVAPRQDPAPLYDHP